MALANTRPSALQNTGRRYPTPRPTDVGRAGTARAIITASSPSRTATEQDAPTWRHSRSQIGCRMLGTGSDDR
jgi:hypothetical protein